MRVCMVEKHLLMVHVKLAAFIRYVPDMSLFCQLISPYCSSITTNNVSVNEVLVATIAHCLLAWYGIPESPNLHVCCMCHIVNLVAQAILHSNSEADNPDITNYYTLNKENPVHIDIENDPEQIELDQEEFPDDNPEGAGPGEAPDPISLEEEEKREACKSPLSKVRFCGVHDYNNPFQLHYITNKIVSSPQHHQKFKKCARAKYPAEVD